MEIKQFSLPVNISGIATGVFRQVKPADLHTKPAGISDLFFFLQNRYFRL
jgi:hypothetical protein